jgi:hypothetical protein
MVEGKLKIGILTTSMGYGHIMKAHAMKAALDRYAADSGRFSIESEIITENDYFTPAGRMIRSLMEGLYGFSSKSSSVRKWWDRRTGSSDYSSGRGLEGIYRKLNSGAGTARRLSGFGCIISTHPFDRVAGLPGAIPVIRVLPDIFAHTFYMIERKGTDTWFAAPDRELAERIRSGKERFVEKGLLPSHKERVIFTGAFCHPDMLDAKKEDFSKLIVKERLPVIFQMGGAGAQLGVMLEAMKRIDYKVIDPVFAVGDHKQAFERLISEAFRLGLIDSDDKEKSFAMKKEDFDHNSIIGFTKGLRIFFHPDRYEAARRIDLLKMDNALNVVKPGDVTSAGIPYLLLYPIGAQEYENGRWAVSKGFAKWLIEPREYELLRKKSPGMIDTISGEMAALSVSTMNRKDIAAMHGRLKEIDARGAYNLAALAVMIAARKRRIADGNLAGQLEKYCTHGFLRGLDYG